MPSQRLISPRLKNPQAFSTSSKFYQDLENGTLGFKKIYQTPCSLSCKLVYNFGYIEDTASVFDRPTVYIFQKK